MTQLPTLLVGAFAGSHAVGVYKVGMAAAALPGRLADPAYAAGLPRLSRLWAAGRFDELRRLLRQSSAIALPVMLLIVAVVVVLRQPILHLLAGARHGSGASAVLAIAIAGSAVDGVLFWNVSVLYAARRSAQAAQNAVITAVFQLAFLLALVPGLKARGAALAFLISTVFNNGRLTWLALRALRRDSAAGDLESPP